MKFERGLFGSRCKQFLYATLTPLLFCAAVLVALVGSFVFSEPPQAFAITCGTGSSITFTDIGARRCRAFITTTGAGTFTVPSDWNNANNTIEVIGGGG